MRALFGFGEAEAVVGPEGADLQGLDGYLEVVDGAGRGGKVQDVFQFAGNVDEFADVVMIEFEVFQFK
jgi:hypothetical protein